MAQKKPPIDPLDGPKMALAGDTVAMYDALNVTRDGGSKAPFADPSAAGTRPSHHRGRSGFLACACQAAEPAAVRQRRFALALWLRSGSAYCHISTFKGDNEDNSGRCL
jgi:hypothetical protein